MLFSALARTKVSTYFLAGMTACISTCAISSNCWSQSDQQVGSGPPLTVSISKEHQQLDLGRLIAGKVSLRQIRLENSSTSDAMLDSINLSCGCVKVVNEPKNLVKAGGGVIVEITVRPSAINEPFKQRLTFGLKLTKEEREYSEVTLDVTGTVTGPVRTNQNRLSFEEGEVAKAIELTSFDPGTEIVSCLPERGVLKSVKTTPITEGGLRINFVPKIGQGTAVEMLRVKLKDSDNQIRTVHLQLPVSLRKQVTFIPNQLIFDRQVKTVTGSAHVIFTGAKIQEKNTPLDASFEFAGDVGPLLSEPGLKVERRGFRAAKITLDVATRRIEGCVGVRVSMGDVSVLLPIIWESDAQLSSK